jgi:DNA mismatch repair ATPase MutS
MDVIEYENGNIKYTYKISKGISYVQGAIRIFEEMNYPSEIIESFKGSTYHATR